VSARAEANTRRVLIVGATSAIAGETARAYAERGDRLFVTGRDPARLAAVVADLQVRGAVQVDSALLEVSRIDRQPEVIEAAVAALGEIDVALLAHGVLPDQARCEKNVGDALRAIEINYTATVALLTLLANRLESQRHGTIAVITSVAGDRGRQSNYVYGSAKGGVQTFLEGLRNRLYHSGVGVVTLKPGFVDTPMTDGVPKNPLFTSARRAGRAIHRAIEARRDTVYIPWFWRPIMAVVKALPEGIFKRLRL
jgi:decaprenylphospho-beta-D-erythro-pentofuranosid-2-ulose 2-reductase